MFMNWLRRHQRKILALVIFGFIVSTFVGFGLYLRSGAGNYDTAAEVNNEKIPYPRYMTLYNQLLSRKRDNKEELNADVIKATKQEVIQALIQETVFHQEAERYGFQVSDQELAQNLASVPAFQKDGKFNPQAYVSILQSVVKTSPKDFEESQRRQIVINHLRDFIMRGMKITDKEVEMELALRQAQAGAQKDPKKRPSLNRDDIRKDLGNEKGAHLLNRWYQQLGTNVKLKVYLDQMERNG